MKRLVDTNVVVVASARVADHAEPGCVVRCGQFLQKLMQEGHLVVDAGNEILREYKGYANQHGQPGPGDAFFQWMLTNLFNPERCTRVPLTAHPTRGYEEFPDDPGLSTFDPSDRKFAAVAHAHPDRPPVAYAIDRGWPNHEAVLATHGVQLEALCP